MDFGGETIRVVCDTHSVYKLTERSMVSDELTGDIVDDAVYKRNQIVFNRFNCNMEIVKMGLMHEVPDIVLQSVLSNTDDYDLVACYMAYCAQIMGGGAMVNLNEVPYLDFTQPYWSQQMIDGFSYKDATFWGTGDLALRYIGGMYVTFVNKTIWSDYFPDIDYYQMALDGDWTLDLLYELSSIVYDDTNLDGNKDSDDMYGFSMNREDPFEGTMTGCLAFLSDKTDDGVPYISIDYERVVGYFDKIADLLYNNPGGITCINDDNVTIMTKFAEGKTMCVINKLFMSETFLREMEDDFAVIPSPKYDEEQEQYNTALHDGLTMFGIPITNTKINMTAMVLEALAAESYRTVTPVYYEMALNVKYVRDNISAIMIDLVREGVVADLALNFGNDIGVDNRAIGFQVRDIIINRPDAVMSSLKSYEEAWQAGLDELLENMEKYGS